MRAGALVLLLVAACLDSPEQGGAGADPDATSGPRCDGNLVSNGSFEESTAGWVLAYATIELVEGGADGGRGAQICFDGDDAGGYYSIDDAPATVTAPAPGETYRVSGWVRNGDAGLTQNVAIGVRVWMGAEPAPSLGFITPGDQWTEVSSSLTVESAEVTEVDVYLAGVDPADGACFQLDAICLQRVD